MTVEVNDAAMDAFWEYWNNTARGVTRVCASSVSYILRLLTGVVLVSYG